jgi:uncharacterized protein
LTHAITLILKGTSECKIYDEKEIEDLFSITYIQKLEFEDWHAEAYLRKKSRQAFRKGTIGKLALWLGQLHHKEILEAKMPPCLVKWINEQKGYGVFAGQDFNSWEFIGEYTGVVRRRNIIFPNLNDYCFMYPRAWFTLKPFTIDSEREGNFTRFINHSDHPNLESVAVFHGEMMHIIFRTIRPISFGDELTYDYGDVYWDKREKVIE